MSLTTFSCLRGAQPDTPAVYFPDAQAGPCTYSQFRGIIAQTIRRLLEAGLAKGDLVALELSNEQLHAVLLVACARIGIATVSGNPLAVQDYLPVKAVFRDRRPLGAMPPAGSATPVIPVDESWYRAGGEPDAFGLDLPEPDADDLCRIMLTSGSTGSPKGVALSYRMVQERIDAFPKVFGLEFAQCSGLMCGMRLSSSLGYAFLFYSLARGGLFCADSADFAKIVGAIRQFGLQALITTPYTLAELVARTEHEGGIRFPRLPLVLTAGSLASPQLARRVRDLLCERLVVFYGTTESGVVSTAEDDSEAGDVGTPVTGKLVEIVDDDGCVVPNGEVGTIRIRRDAGPLPYFELSGWKQQTPRESFSPGDVGSFNTLGHLVIHGRADNVINLGGTKTTFELLEQMLLAAPGVRDCGVICQRDQLGIDRITAVLVLDPFWDQAKFLSYCEANIIRDFLPTKFVLATQIPRNRNNKIDREALAKIAG
jgi:long-chain acyl-CoA synthetase